jgi:hypothetical protein
MKAEKILVEVCVGWHTMILWADMPMIKALQSAVQADTGYINGVPVTYIVGQTKIRILADDEYPTMDKEAFMKAQATEKSAD